jgi:hypothetical protein
MYLNEIYKRVKEMDNSTLPLPVPPSFTSSLNVSDYLFPGDTSQAQANNTQGVLCLEEGYLSVGRSQKKYQAWGLPCLHPAILEEIRHLSYLILNISLFGIIPFYNRLNFCSEHKQLPKGIKERLL